MKFFEFLEFLGRIAYEWDKALKIANNEATTDLNNEPLHFKIDRMMESLCNVVGAQYNSLYNIQDEVGESSHNEGDLKRFNVDLI